MMGHFLRFTLPLALVVSLVGALVVSMREAPAATSAQKANGNINVTATLSSMTLRQLGRGGRLSDATEQKWRLNDRNGRPIGRMLLACRWVVSRARLCQGEITMPLGKITVAGSSPTALEGEYAVTGGTGFYRGGGGVMLFTAIGLRKQVLFITINT